VLGTERPWIVVLKGTGACRFGPDEVLDFQYDLPTGLISFVWVTPYFDEGHESKVPRGLLAMAALDAPDMEAAVEVAARYANVTAATIATVVNATIEDLEPVVVYERLHRGGEREFLQVHVPRESGLPRRARAIRPNLILDVLAKTTSSSETERLSRAALHYNIALRSWRAGHEIDAVAPLWMAVETLTDAALRSELAATGFDEEGLAVSWSIDITRPRREWRGQLVADVRRRLIFENDDATYSDAKKASDGWEHGFLDFEEVRKLAVAARDATAMHVRRSILRLAGITGELAAHLDSSPYGSPREWFPYARYLRGWLVGEIDNPAADNEGYPVLNWTYEMTSFRKSGENTYEIAFKDEALPRFANGVAFRPDRVQLWGPAGDPDDDAAK
jgi:hypothetical protein